MIESEIERITSELRAEANIDFSNLSFIAGCVEDLGLRSQEQIRRHTLEVIRRLMERGVFPGDYTLDDLVNGSGFQFRSGTPSDLLAWIEAEWIIMGHTPTLENPICWFALKPSNTKRLNL